MQSVTVTRHLEAPPSEVRERIQDLEPFMAAAGFDEVDVDGDYIGLAKAVGLLQIELDLEVVDREGADLAYVQRDGIFEEMETRYVVEATDEWSAITATTEFALDVALVGNVLDGTVIKRQRRTELTDQFDWLARECKP